MYNANKLNNVQKCFYSWSGNYSNELWL